MKEIQELSVHPEIINEQTRFTVENPDDEDYRLIFRNPKDITRMTPSGPIKGKATAEEFKEAIKMYYWNGFKTGIKTTRTMFDENNEEVTDIALAKKLVYLVSCYKLMAS